MSTTETVLEAARLAADLLIALAGSPERARVLITDAEWRRANAVADAAEIAKGLR